MTKNVLWFSEISKTDVATAGGKGANLGEMANLKLPVPPGFVTTTDAYFSFINANGIDQKIKELTNNLDVSDTKRLQDVSKEIKNAIESGSIPGEIKAEIIESYNRLCGATLPIGDQEVYVAVRSSASAEDLPDASFAGQQATFLNIKGAEAVVDAVRRCWASLFEARAIFYRQEKGFDHLKVGLAAVVQKMIQSETAGVMFTVDSITNDPTKIEIEAAYGLGEIVVSGAVTPDRYLISKETMKIVSKDIARQDWMITKVGVENKHVDVIEDLKEKQKLRDEEIVKVAEYGKKIEQHYGMPQDLEWAVEKGRIYIVQSRAITTIKKKEETKAEVKEIGGISKEGGIAIEKASILLRGLGASPGTAVGPVKIIYSPEELTKIQKGDVLVTDMTTPDYVVGMRKAAAVVTNAGGTTAHAAIVSRELGIACIVGTKKATDILKDGQIITVDAVHGIVYEGIVELEQRKEADKSVVSSEGAVITGTKIYVNLAEPSLASRVSSRNVDGVGLLRAEFMIAEIGEHPKKMLKEGRENEFIDKLAEGLRTIAQAFYPRPVVYRATDFKTNEYRSLKGGEEYEPLEANPMMGYRGCARYMEDPDVFKLELEAIKKVREVYGLKNLWLMIPFVRKIGELRAVKDILEEVDLHHTIDFKLWIMVEVPSNVFLIEDFCKEGIDGISIGSNDLTQLILGIDRDNATMAKVFDERNAAVINAIQHVIKVCRKYGVTTSLCGQAPSVYPEFTEKLVEFGINSISVNPDVIEQVRKLVASSEQKAILNRLAQLLEKE
ncbi:phosphoenolpyruvate synthase [Candidatus Micrarchaeota archaeon]|nr:phosphoenolpyruvate synthase [Candidatus Micrarchaeota archaeon]